MSPFRWRSRLSSVSFFQEFRDEPGFDFLTGPRCFAQKRQAGFHCRIELETTDRDATAHLAPTMLLDELIDDAFQRDAVQWIARMVGR